MIGLGDFPEGYHRSQANAVSADGSIIVGMGTSDESQAFIWDQAHGLRSLQQVLTDFYGMDLSGIFLHEATGISADGRTIVGKGDFESHPQAWLVQLPEPGDTDLDGDVDLGALASHYGATSSVNWRAGDFDDDGDVDLNDLGALASNYGNGMAGGQLRFEDDYPLVFGAMIPEPGCLGLCAVLLAALSRSRRRRLTDR